MHSMGRRRSLYLLTDFFPTSGTILTIYIFFSLSRNL
jgi:hypothetical protein